MTLCATCKQPLSDLDVLLKTCRACRAAASRRWYSENSTLATSQRGLRAKVKRRLAGHVPIITEQLTKEQDGACACCGTTPIGSTLAPEFSLDQTNDAGIPLVRAMTCRSCKIAVSRVVHPSRFVLQPERLDAVEAYLKRPWQDPDVVLRRAGIEVRRRHEVVAVADQYAAAVARTDETVDFLKSIGAMPG